MNKYERKKLKRHKKNTAAEDGTVISKYYKKKIAKAKAEAEARREQIHEHE